MSINLLLYKNILLLVPGQKQTPPVTEGINSFTSGRRGGNLRTSIIFQIHYAE